ncbi:helix-turn-helix transcriptional regulator [Lysinibacillus pakistanensis]|uniref:helix-turn-helix domain-containing protein n=1 Tax=Lysinibacillus pakistanensis TaxID=759811 RepID=UPI003D2E8370
MIYNLIKQIGVKVGVQMQLKSRLKVILAEHDMSQKDLAEATGLTARLISEIVNNKVKMYPKEALEKIMTALNVKDVGELFTTIEKTDN